MALLHTDKPQYLREAARPFYRRARVAHRGRTTATTELPAADIWEWVILAPNSDDVAKDEAGNEYRFLLSDPRDIKAMREMVVALNQKLAEAPPAPVSKKGG